MKGYYSQIIIVVAIFAILLTLVSAQNLSSNTSSTGEPIGIPDVKEKPDIRIELGMPDKVTRGQEFTLTVSATNLGIGTAKNATLNIVLADGFSADNTIHECGDMEISSICEFTTRIKTSIQTATGKSRVKVLADYE